MALRSNLPPGAYSVKNPLGGAQNVAIPYTIPAIVGQSLGSGAVVLAEQIASHTASGFDPLANVASGDPNTLISIDRVSDRADGVANYFEGRHFQKTNGMLDWSIRPTLTNPAMDEPIVSNSGAGILSGTYYYVVTVRNNTTGESSWVSGQTFASALVGPSVASGTIKIGWEAIDNALDYRIYRTQTLDVNGRPRFSGSGQNGLLATVNGATQYVDDGTDTVVSATDPPSTNTAFDEPVPTEAYEVDYTYRKFKFNSPKKYRSIEDVFRDHGFGSQVSIMAEFAMAEVPGRGNSAPAVWIVAAGDSDNPMDPPGLSHYQTALTGLSTILDDHLVVVLGATSANIRTQLKQYVETESNLTNRREKVAIVWAPNNTAIGSSGVASSLLGIANTMSSDRIVLAVPDSGAATAYIQDQDTGTRELGTMEPEYLAAAVAGKLSSLPDPAEPLTRKQITGPIRLAGAREYNPQEMEDLRRGGVLIVDYKSESNWNVYQGITTQTATQDQMELSVVLASDVVAFAWREAIDPRTSGSAQASLIGSKLTPGLLDAVRQRTVLVLDNLAKEGIINGYDKQSISVEQDSVVKTRVNVTFNYEPIFPVNTVILTFSSSFTLNG